MNTQFKPTEIWIELHYRYKGESYKFNLPLPQGGKFLDGLRLDFNRKDMDRGRRFTVIMETLGEVELEAFVLTGHMNYGDNLKSIWANGYQSWTESREQSPGERINALNWPGKLLFFHRTGDAYLHPYSEKKGRFHGYTYAYLRFQDRIFLTGSLDESAGYTIIGTDVRRNIFTLTKDVAGFRLKGKQLLLDIVMLEGGEDDVFHQFAHLRNQIPLPRVNAAMWTSRHAGGVGEVSIRHHLASYRERKIPLDYFIIDYGWEKSPGDWEVLLSGFPSGLASLAAEIRDSGYAPGIGFAPFVVGSDSVIFRTKKKWLARGRGRRIRPAGWSPRYGGAYYALDVSRKDVQDFIADTVGRFRDDWSFQLLRMDLLHVPAIFPPDGMSRGMALDRALEFLTSIKGDAVYQWSSVPLGGAFGRADFCRIASDTTPYWEHLFRRNIHFRERPSTVNALRSTVGRRHLDGRFFANDTDVVFLKGRRRGMEPPRRYTQLFLQSLFSGSIATSDDITGLDEDESRLFLSLFPVATPKVDEVVESRRTVTIRYRMGNRSYVSISNLADGMRSFVLPEGFWFAAPGLRRRAYHVAGGRRQYFKSGETRNYLRLEDESPFAGSDGHIFPGAEIAGIMNGEDGWHIEAKPGVLRDFRVWIRIPDLQSVRINGEEGEIIRTPSGACLAIGTVRFGTLCKD